MVLGKLYKHKNCTDVAIELLRQPSFVKENSLYKMKVRWFNVVNPDNIYYICEGNIEIKKEDLKNWKLFEAHESPLKIHAELPDDECQ